MKWKIPMHWEMVGVAEVEAGTLREAVDLAPETFNPVDESFLDGSYEVDCDDIASIRRDFNDGRLDRDYDAYPELRMYNEAGFVSLVPLHKREDRKSLWAVKFRVDDQQYTCVVRGQNFANALGRFFMNHTNLTYNHVLEVVPYE